METPQDVRKLGYLRKQKTMKKKLFVLREETDHGVSRLEYYDTEKKFVCSRPKRSIQLHKCFSIQAKSDSKHKYGIVLYTKEDCFSIICDNEDERKDWLSTMLELRNCHSQETASNPMYEHIWPVTVKSRGLGSGKRLIPGQYRLCLTTKELSFIRLSHDDPDLIFQLPSIRRCAHTECFFYLELGRSAVTGAGELWMQVEDTVIAHSIHEAVLSFMAASKTTDQPHFRPRRHSSAEKSHKPNAPSRQRGTPTGSTPFTSSTLPIRSKTISTADNPHRSPIRKRLSQSPSKLSAGGASLRPISTFTMSHSHCSSSTSPISARSSEDPRSRADSMESSGSKTADEVDHSPMEDLQTHIHLSSTPTKSPDTHMPQLLDDYLPMDHSKARQTSESSDIFKSGASPGDKWSYQDSMSVSPICQRQDAYMEMTVSPSTELPTRRQPLTDDYFEMKPEQVKPEPKREDDDVNKTVNRGISSPQLKPKSEPNDYVPMNPSNSSILLDESSYMDMSHNSSRLLSTAASSSSSVSEPDNSYFRMSGNRSLSLGEHDEYFEVDQPASSYMKMGGGRSSSPRPFLRPDRVQSYLADSPATFGSLPHRSSSVGSRPQVVYSKSFNDPYVDMQNSQVSRTTPPPVTSPSTSSSTKCHQKTSSAPLLNLPGPQTGQGQSSATKTPTKQSNENLEQSREEKDFLMEMDFNRKRTILKEHDYEDIRPRSASGGPHDFQARYGASASQDFQARYGADCRRTGSFGCKDKMSKIAALTRQRVMDKPDSEYRPRVATISQDTFRVRTSSLGNNSADMRPRSSSHGNSRYMELTRNRLKKDLFSYVSSQDSLPTGSKRTSQDSFSSSNNDYLDMRPQVSSSPSRALVATFKHMDRPQPGSGLSPQLTDSDYLSMDPSECSTESGKTDSPVVSSSSHRTSHRSQRHTRTHSKGKSITSQMSHSSSESLTSNNSRTSESTDHSSGRSSSAVTEDKDGYFSGSSPAADSSRGQSVHMDDAYVIYSPSSTLEPLTVTHTMDKVSSPIRAEEPPRIGISTPAHSAVKPTCDKKTSPYVNIKYSQNICKPEPKDCAVSTNTGSKFTTPSPFHGASGSGKSLSQKSSIGIAPQKKVPSPPVAIGGSEAVDSDYIMVEYPHKDKSNCRESSPSMPSVPHPPAATPSTPEQKASKTDAGARPRPRLPQMPVPFPSLEPGPSEAQAANCTEESDYMEFSAPLQPSVSSVQQSVSSAQQDRSQSSQAECGAVASRPLTLSTSKTSLENSGEQDLNYATLDLQADEPAMLGAATWRPKHASGGSGCSDSSEEGPLQYAQIDFNKSEDLRKSSEKKKTKAPFDL